MSQLALMVVALLLMLVSLPLLSFGTDQDVQALWISGLALLTAGGLIPPTLRFVMADDGDEEESDQDQEDKDSGG
jgi:hypothetical protein